MIHLRPIPNDLEFTSDLCGLFAGGKFYRMSPATVKILRLMQEKSPGYVPKREIARRAGISLESIKPMISRIRFVLNAQGYSLQNSHSQGYRMVKFEVINEN